MSGTIKRDGRADISTKEHRRRPRDPSIKGSKIRDLTVRSSELLFFLNRLLPSVLVLLSRRPGRRSSDETTGSDPNGPSWRFFSTPIHHKGTSNSLFFQLHIVEKRAKFVRYT